MPDKEVQIGFRGTPEYRERLQREALNRKIKVQALIERAVESYLSSDTPKVNNNRVTIPEAASPSDLSKLATTPQETEWLERLLTVLRASPRLAKLIKEVLAAFYREAVRRGGSRNAEEDPSDEPPSNPGGDCPDSDAIDQVLADGERLARSIEATARELEELAQAQRGPQSADTAERRELGERKVSGGMK